VISASHNPYEDNGIKFFDATGSKLSDETEARIEALLDGPALTRESVKLGPRHARGQVARRLPGVLRLDDSEGHGPERPQDRDRLRARRILQGGATGAHRPGCGDHSDRLLANGKNINLRCGSTAPELLQLTVSGVQADVGIALDGDGDRLVMVDHLGRLVDGDRLLYVIALDRQEQGELRGPVVGTVMSNLGLEQALKGRGIDFLRAAVR